MKTFKRILTVTLISFVMLGCGEEKKEKEGFTYERKSSSTETKKEDDNVANIVLTADDFMKYNTNEIKVKAGQKVRLTLRHIGKLDKNVMGHNIVILNNDVDMVAFATKAATQKENDYIPVGTSDVLAHTKMIGGGQTVTIEFDAPEVGIYQFLCSFPAHYAMMKGEFIVE